MRRDRNWVRRVGGALIVVLAGFADGVPGDVLQYVGEAGVSQAGHTGGAGGQGADGQQAAKEQFQTTLERFKSVTNFSGGIGGEV